VETLGTADLSLSKILVALRGSRIAMADVFVLRLSALCFLYLTTSEAASTYSHATCEGTG